MNNGYDKAIGYSPLNDVDQGKLERLISIIKTLLGQYYLPKEDDIILVAGAGHGDEAYQIYKIFQLMTIGVDINIQNAELFLKEKKLSLQTQDLAALAFRNKSFSLIYSYHVLEHVIDPVVVLKELKRVLHPSGVLFIGFPNKRRLFSYFGTSQKASLLEKLKWNINDYIHRIRGKFENRFGAHAGFSEKEFLESSSEIFEYVKPVRNQYMTLKYSRFKWLIKFLIFSNMAEFFFPSNYYICKK